MRIVMMGTGTFAEPTFEALLAGSHPVVGLVTRPDKPVGEVRGSTRQVGSGMANIARERGVPVFQPESVNSAEGIAGLREFHADLLVVAAYGQILSKEVLEAAPKGGINVHGSLLPKYRGAAPVAWAIYHGETHTGVTIIRMTTGLDAGDMLAQESLQIGPEETAGELEARLAPLGARLVMQVIDAIAAGTARGVQQDKTQVTKAPKLTKEHGLIDWSMSSVVLNHIRAMQPWPTAYTFLHQPYTSPQRILIYRANSAENVPGLDLWPRPGTLMVGNETPPSLFVHSSPGYLLNILELQPSGKKRMPAAQFLRGHRLAPGAYFGPEST